MTEEQLAKRYKEIEAKKINDDIIVVELFDCKENPLYHSRILFAYNKLYYTSSGYGFIFGGDIKHILSFFKGDKINPGYWKQKCEAAESPIIEEDVNLEKLHHLVCEYFESEGLLSTTSEKYDFEDFFDSLDTFWYEVADKLSGFLSGLAIDDADFIARSFVWDSRDFSTRYLYACEVIQWVENKDEVRRFC